MSSTAKPGNSWIVRASPRSLLLPLVLTSCVHVRDYHSAEERITDNTAYTEHARVRIDAGLLEPDMQSFVVDVGVTTAVIRDRLSFGINLAHAAIGVVSIDSNFTAVDTRWYALGGRVAFTYLNPRSFWFLPRDLRLELGAFNAAVVPVELWNSFPVARWLTLNLGLAYRGLSLWGDYDDDALLLDANFARRALTLDPVAQFFIAGRVALFVGARLPVFAQRILVGDAQFEVAPDLLLGVRSVEWRRVEFVDAFQLEGGLEVRFGWNTHMRLGVNAFAFRPFDALQVMPSLNFYWRFR